MAKHSLFARLFGAASSDAPTHTKMHSSQLPFAAQAYVTQPGKPVWMRRDYTKFADEAYTKNVIAHRAIHMLANGAASVKFKLFAYESDGKRQELRQHPLLQLLQNPSPLHSASELFEALYAHKLISGNAYLHAVAPQGVAPKELHVLRPDRMQIIAGNHGAPQAYRYKVGETGTDFPVDQLTGRSSVLHLKAFHPLDDWYGLSPIEAAAYSIDQHNQAGAWNQALLQNGARPSGALVVNQKDGGAGQLSQEQYSRLRDQMDEQFSGAINAGRPLLLEGGLDWKEMSLSPKDMDFLDAKHSSARDIALAFGVPPQMLGIPGDNTYSNLAEARLALWEQTILPMVTHLADALNSWLVPLFDAQLEIAPDLDGISALAPKREAYWQRINAADFLSDDEKRELLGIRV